MTEIAVEDWLKATIETAVELGSGALGFDPSEALLGSIEGVPRGMGSYVPILSPNASMHVGIVADDTGCMILTRALLGMGPEEHASADDVADAIGEIVNMLGGGVKTRLAAREPKLQLGLPIFVEGRIQPSHNTRSATGSVLLGETKVSVLVIMGSRN